MPIIKYWIHLENKPGILHRATLTTYLVIPSKMPPDQHLYLLHRQDEPSGQR